MTSRKPYFILFGLSGFTGLIYESIWSQYLKLFLGHAAYAQALVLAIFMGGMALGAWLVGRYMSRWTNLLVMYAAVEFAIGLFGIGFHDLFQSIRTLSYDIIIPELDSPFHIHLYKWVLAAILILPQSVLLGMTFPLMSNGVLRRFTIQPGQSISLLYFSNSLGAAIGVLVSGFFIIALAGLPGTIKTAAYINLFIALIVYLMARSGTEKKTIFSSKTHPALRIPHFLLFAALVTGTASFIYEIAWIRMLSMVLGSSTHAFELMLSAFITGLALGSLWIRNRIDRFTRPLQSLGAIQIVMGLFALITLPLYNFTFDLMGYFISILDKTESGYWQFTLISHAIALLVMLPATFMAGMTLPLLSLTLLKQGYGEKSISHVYAFNTLGAILGVIFTVFLGMPLLGLKGAMLTGCALDMTLGILLMMMTATGIKPGNSALPACTCILVMSIALVGTELDTRRMASGVFRPGINTLSGTGNILFHRDGKTATISVIDHLNGNISIATNGKPDASINMISGAQSSTDEITMVLAAAIPLSLNPSARHVANIGMGSGLTTHTLLAWDGIEKVDTIEIEQAMVDGATLFRPRVERTYVDPRSHIYIEDAKTFFSSHQNKYDLIVSEPSNPWISGTSSLFSSEFYRDIKRYLARDGLLVQWLQIYEINTDLVFSVLKALSMHFTDYTLYAADNTNILIVARQNGKPGLPNPRIFSNEELRHELKRVDIHNINDIHARFLGDHNIYTPLLRESHVKTNSDYMPILDLYAPRTMFLGQKATEIADIKLFPIPFLELLLPEYNQADSATITPHRTYRYSARAHKARQLIEYLHHGQSDINEAGIPGQTELEVMIQLAKYCQTRTQAEQWINNLFRLIQLTIPYLNTGEIGQIIDEIAPKCNDALTDDQHDWLVLFNSLAQQDPHKMIQTANRLFQNHGRWTLDQQQLLYATQMLGHVVIGEISAAQNLYDNHFSRLFKQTAPLAIDSLNAMANVSRSTTPGPH